MFNQKQYRYLYVWSMSQVWGPAPILPMGIVRFVCCAGKQAALPESKGLTSGFQASTGSTGLKILH